ncbi:MAG TPA: hypothetical protein ENN23_05045 [Deltaproteobacteria bacterium]|nr:hypothetical protein [Deltaproteobacteria bacterium]
MELPEKYLDIRNKFVEALKTGNFSAIAAISLDDLKLAKIHLSADRNLPYYSLLAQTLTEREKATMETKEGVRVAGVESNYAQNQHIFLAHKFTDEGLITPLKKTIEQHKFFWAEANKKDLGKISTDVLAKIKKSGFFIAVMTMQHELRDGNFTSDSWVLEKKAAALAFGQRPVIMAEEGIERHYIGFVQSDEQIISFTRDNFSARAQDVINGIDTIYKKSLTKGLI